jgi:predicted ATP-dependent protease
LSNTFKAPLYSDKSDVVFSSEGEYNKIQGGSGGACAALALTMALEGMQLKRGVAVTGCLDLLGSVLTVGSLREKAQGCASRNPPLLLVAPSANVEGLRRRLKDDDSEDVALRSYLEGVVPARTFIDVLASTLEGNDRP